MSDRPIGLGKVAENGTLNENGAFYSVQDVNVLLENAGGSGGGDLPTPTVADAGKAVVVDEEGKYALGAAGGGGNTVIIPVSSDESTIQITAGELREYIAERKNIVLEKYASATYGDVTFETDQRYYLVYYNTKEAESEIPSITEYIFDFLAYDTSDTTFYIRRFFASSLSDNPAIGQ